MWLLLAGAQDFGTYPIFAKAFLYLDLCVLGDDVLIS